MLLDHNKFLVKSQSKAFSAKKNFQIMDDQGQAVGTATDTTGFFPGLFGSATIEVRDVSNNRLLFTIGRSGVVLKRDHLLDAEGRVVGRYKAKMFSLSGGFHIYDKDGKQLAEIQGKMLRAEYKFLTPDKVEMGKVSRTWGGLAQSLFTGNDTYGVEINSQFAKDETAKMLILGATIGIESIFKEKENKSGSGGGGGREE